MTSATFHILDDDGAVLVSDIECEVEVKIEIEGGSDPVVTVTAVHLPRSWRPSTACRQWRDDGTTDLLAEPMGSFRHTLGLIAKEQIEADGDWCEEVLRDHGYVRHGHPNDPDSGYRRTAA